MERAQAVVGPQQPRVRVHEPPEVIQGQEVVAVVDLGGLQHRVPLQRQVLPPALRGLGLFGAHEVLAAQADPGDRPGVLLVQDVEQVRDILRNTGGRLGGRAARL